MAACRRVYDSRHLQADCQEPGDQFRNPTLIGNRVWATFTFFTSRQCFRTEQQPTQSRVTTSGSRRQNRRIEENVRGCASLHVYAVTIGRKRSPSYTTA